MDKYDFINLTHINTSIIPSSLNSAVHILRFSPKNDEWFYRDGKDQQVHLRYLG
jgi:hypothetical protein